MHKSAKIDPLLAIRLVGAGVGAIGFLLLAYQQVTLGTGLIGIGSVIIASAGGK